MRGESKPPRLPPPTGLHGDREQGRVPGCWLLSFSTCSIPLSTPGASGPPPPSSEVHCPGVTGGSPRPGSPVLKHSTCGLLGRHHHHPSPLGL